LPDPQPSAALLRLHDAVERIGGTARPIQERVTLAVEEALRSDGRVLIQAGCGAGKGLAYASALAADGRSAVVLHPTTLLRRQWVRKDAVAARLRADEFLGRQSWLCLRKAVDAIEEDPDLAGTVRWAVGQQAVSPVPLDELFAEGEEHMIKLLSCGSSCLGRSCPRYDSCYGVVAGRRAKAAPVLSSTHHMIWPDLRSKGFVLGYYPSDEDRVPEARRVAIVDEVHLLPDAVRLASQLVLRPATIEAIGRTLARAGDAEQGKVLVRARVDFEKFLLQAGASPNPDDVVSALSELSETAKDVWYRHVPAKDPKAKQRSESALAHLEGLRRKCAEIIDKIDKRCIEVEEGTLKATVVDVTPILGRWLGQFDAVVGLSATITLAMGRRLGMQDAERIDVGSAFRPDQAVCLIPPLPDPGTEPEAHEEAALALAEDLVRASGGRALVHFTSIERLERAVPRFERLAADIGTRCYVLLGPRAKEQSRLWREDISGIALGCRIASVGLDAPGETCQLVVIMRLPFPAPSPLVDAQMARFGDAGFALVSLEEAMCGLGQVAGRLIRSETDRGVVAILDPRVLTRRYGKQLLAMLPPCRMTRSAEATLGALRRLALVSGVCSPSGMSAS